MTVFFTGSTSVNFEKSAPETGPSEMPDQADVTNDGKDHIAQLNDNSLVMRHVEAPRGLRRFLCHVTNHSQTSGQHDHRGDEHSFEKAPEHIVHQAQA